MQTGQILLRILDGVHGGASIALDAKNTWIVGSSMSADIPLVDEGIAEQHARIDLDAHADTVVLTALAEGVLVFGQPLAADSAISLRIGSELGIGPVSMRFCATMAGLAMEDTSIDEAGVAAARRHALKQLNRRAYLMSLGRSVWRSRLARYGVLAVVGMATLGWLAWRPDRPTAADHARAIEHIRTRFPDITIHYSEPTGVTTYAGYVDTHAQLGELRASALAADHGRAIIQVVPMEALQWNALQILDDLYVNPGVTVLGPGAIEVKLPAPSAVKGLRGWDFNAAEEKLRSKLPELRQVRIVLATRQEKGIAVDWSRRPYSVVSTQANTYFAITESGERIFGGARSGEGVIRDIHRCGMVIDSGQGSYFTFEAAHGEDQNICGK